MADEIIKTETDSLVSTIDKHGVGEMLKPLIQEIHLFDSYVAGTTHLDDRSVLDEIKADDRLNLMREDNKYDEHAILIITESGKKLGYVPEKDNIIFSRLMDAGKKLIAKIKNIEKKDSFNQISIGIYLVDF
ncbi:MAG: HIRAN domain-containing protein [Lachnospiraceae bacterium]|nr:HIRAN domain-containing protein [Lachnospiraceae bacterium]